VNHIKHKTSIRVHSSDFLKTITKWYSRGFCCY